MSDALHRTGSTLTQSAFCAQTQRPEPTLHSLWALLPIGTESVCSITRASIIQIPFGMWCYCDAGGHSSVDVFPFFLEYFFLFLVLLFPSDCHTKTEVKAGNTVTEKMLQLMYDPKTKVVFGLDAKWASGSDIKAWCKLGPLHLLQWHEWCADPWRVSWHFHQCEGIDERCGTQ